MSYEPSHDDWQARPPAELGMDRETLALAIDYHRGHETRWPRDFLTESGRYIGVADESPTRDEVPGSHWGGGLWMSTRDHARFGLLVHRAGRWQGRALLPAAWVDEMRRPCPINPAYGLLWWLNTGRRQLPSAPESSYAARGAGSNVIWIDPEHDLVTVVHWIDKPHVDGFVQRVLASVAT